MKGLPLDHVAIAVPSIEEAAPVYESLTGARRSHVEEIDSQGVRVCFVGSVELLEPTSTESTVARFLTRNGSGLHHIAYRTHDLRRELERLEAEGFELIDRNGRPGAGGHRVAFLHPRSTGGVLTELVERAGD